MSGERELPQDAVDRHIEQWSRELDQFDRRTEAIITRIQMFEKHLALMHRRELDDLGLPEGDQKTLHALRRQGPPYRATPTELAREQLASPAAMTGRLDRLERDGYVTRTHDTADRRRILVELTPAGHATWERSMEVMGRSERALVNALSPTDQEQLSALLKKLLLAAEQGLGG